MKHFLLVNSAICRSSLAQSSCLDALYFSVHATATTKDSSTLNSANRLQSNFPAFIIPA